MEELVINGIEYIKKDSLKKIAENEDSVFCIFRTYSAGVFAGYCKKEDLLKSGKIEITNSIRLWQWFGASLSQLSQEGTPDASKCKFAMTEQVKYIETIEITPCTEKAKENLLSVKQWKV